MSKKKSIVPSSAPAVAPPSSGSGFWLWSVTVNIPTKRHAELQTVTSYYAAGSQEEVWAFIESERTAEETEFVSLKREVPILRILNI